MTFHYIEFMTTCHATEDLTRVKEALHAVTLHEVEWEKEEAEGHYGNPILIIKGKLSRNTQMDDVFKNLPDSVIDELKRDLSKRIDENCNFFFRLDKSKAYLGDLSLSIGDNTIRVRARVESYPAKRKTALKKMSEYFDDLTEGTR